MDCHPVPAERGGIRTLEGHGAFTPSLQSTGTSYCWPGYQPTGELIKSIAPVFVFVLLFAPRCGNEQARHLPSACFSSSSQLAGALIAHTDTHTAVKNGGIGLSAVLAMLPLCSVHGQTQQQNEAVPSPVLQPLVM